SGGGTAHSPEKDSRRHAAAVAGTPLRSIKPRFLSPAAPPKVRALQTCETAQDCGFAGAGRPEEHRDRKRVRGARHACSDHRPAGESLLEIRQKVRAHSTTTRRCRVYATQSTTKHSLSRNSAVSPAAA